LTKITTIEELERLYGAPTQAALVKEIDYISDHYRAFIEKAPFVIVASSGPHGLDCSPRGDPAGFARVRDRKTILIPDRRGNNRIDTLRNIVFDPRVSLLFMIPGVGNTLRVNGRAEVYADPALCAEFGIQGRGRVRFYRSPRTTSTSNAQRRSCARGYGVRMRKFHALSCLRRAKFSRVCQMVILTPPSMTTLIRLE
jgi:predicted pyridoxine 5'-phosphate oxidase superfamily flavin-nucleotide-binding protein